jgi:hypothetical protein
MKLCHGPEGLDTASGSPEACKTVARPDTEQTWLVWCSEQLQFGLVHNCETSDDVYGAQWLPRYDGMADIHV